jgi:MinD-like ATPase involved in chromosome partitioning or flagellar assembly
MTIIAIFSAKGSPGVTTVACAIGAVWPSERRVIVAEGDPAGADLAARFGLSSRQGMTSLVLALRQPASPNAGFDAHTQRLPGGLEVLVGPMAPDAAQALDRELGRAVPFLAEADEDVLVDCGRLVPGQPGQTMMLQRAHELILVSRSDVASLGHARWAAGLISSFGRAGSGRLIVRGGSRGRAREAAAMLGLELVEVIPEDPGSAAIACGEPGSSRAFAKSPLVGAANRAAEILVPLARESERAGPDSPFQPGTETPLPDWRAS